LERSQDAFRRDQFPAVGFCQRKEQIGLRGFVELETLIAFAGQDRDNRAVREGSPSTTM
jgi:hypothetical protein